MNSILILPILLPMSAALLAILWRGRSREIGILAQILTLAAVILLIFRLPDDGLLTHTLGGWSGGLGITLRADGLALVFLGLTSSVSLVAGWYALSYFSGKASQVGFWPIWLMLIAALHGLLLSADLFNLYVTLEMLGLGSVTLVTLSNQRAAVESALRYLMVGLLGSLAFLAGVALIYSRYGTLDMLLLQGMVNSEPATWIALSLMSTGLLVKSALFPLHFWLPAAHSGAPAPVSAVLSALVVKAAFYLLMRLWLELLQPVMTPAVSWTVGLLGAAAVIWGSWNALFAKRLKLLAAHSTVAQLGYLFMFLPLLLALPPGVAKDTLTGALLLMLLSHGFAKSALFLAAGTIQKSLGHDRIDDMGGVARRLPVTNFALALAGVSLVGLPPSGAFLAKWQLVSTAITLGQWLWVAVVAIGSLMAAAYLFKVLNHTFGEGMEQVQAPGGSQAQLPALLLALVATLLLGLGAAPLWEFVGLHGESMEGFR